MKRTYNTLDIQALLGSLETDIIEAQAAERSDWEYDEYLTRDEDLDQETIDRHEERLRKLDELLELVKWYRSDRVRF